MPNFIVYLFGIYLVMMLITTWPDSENVKFFEISSKL